MNDRQLPLLCHNTDVYSGPNVPVSGLRGHVHADGMSEEDSLRIVGRLEKGGTKFLGQLTLDVTAIIFDPKLYVYVSAVREKSSGKPITVWVG